MQSPTAGQWQSGFELRATSASAGSFGDGPQLAGSPGGQAGPEPSQGIQAPEPAGILAINTMTL